MGSVPEQLGEKELTERLRALVRIPSRSSSTGGDEGRLQAEIERQMRRAGARVRVFYPVDAPGFFSHPLCHGPQRQYEDRPTVIGEIGPPDAPALLVLAHSDTVPLYEPKAWTVDPFGGELRDGAVWGLGASDDKWGLVSIIGILEHLKAREASLRRRVIFASTVDEESGVGNGTLLLHLAGVRAEVALYLDGLRMDISIGCLGGSNLYLRPIREQENGLSADVERLRQACAALSGARAPLFRGPPFERNHLSNSSVKTMLCSLDGQQIPTVAFYTLPGEAPNAIEQQLEAMVREALGERIESYRLEYRMPWFEPAAIDPNSFLVRSICASMRQTLGREPVVTTLSKQDSFVLTNHFKIPTVSFGPTARTTGRGAFHSPDEYLKISELWDAYRVALGTVLDWLDQ